MSRTPMQPNQAGAFFRRGTAALNAGNLGAAIRDLAAAAQGAPDARSRASALQNLGIAYARSHQHERAIDALRQAEALSPKDPVLPGLLAVSLHTLERLSEAAEACRRARRLDRADAGMTSLLVDCLVRLRRDEDAARVVEEADRQGIVSAGLDESFAMLAIRTGRAEEAVPRLRRHQDREDLDPKARARVLYALGDALDALGRCDEAWEAYDAANRAVQVRFDADGWRRGIEQVCATWTPERIAALQQGASDDDRAVLIVGMPRSGTTLVELTLGRHSGVHMGGEMTALGEVYQLLMGRAGAPPDVAPDRLTPDHIREAGAHYSSIMDRVGMGSRRVTNKMPMNVPMLGLFAAMYPNGTVVHCRRDPRDVCLSCYFRNFRYDSPFMHRPEWIAVYYEGYARLVRHWGGVLPALGRAPRLHEVAYEDMVADHETHARALVDAVGLDWEDACRDPSGARREAATLRSDQIGKGVYDSSAGRHRRYASHTGPWEHLRAPSFSDPA